MKTSIIYFNTKILAHPPAHMYCGSPNPLAEKGGGGLNLWGVQIRCDSGIHMGLEIALYGPKCALGDIEIDLGSY